MLRLFERNTVVQVVIILMVTVLVWQKGYATPLPMNTDGHFAPLYSLLCDLHLASPVATTIALLLSLLGGFFFNITLVRAGLASQNSLLPTLLFVLAVSATSPSLSPTLLATLVDVAFVSMLMLHSTLLTVSSDKIFGAAALIGIASLLSLPALSLILAYALIAINYRLYSWRDWMVFLLGLLAPYILLWTILFLTGHIGESLALMASDFSDIGLHIAPFTPLQAVANATLLIIFAAGLLVVWRHLGEKTVVWQKNATTILLLTFAALASLLFSQTFPVRMQTLAIPFAFCTSFLLSLHKQRRHGKHQAWRTRAFDLLFIVIILAAIAC